MLPLYDETQTERGEKLLAQSLDRAPPYDPLLRAAASSNVAGALTPSSARFPPSLSLRDHAHFSLRLPARLTMHRMILEHTHTHTHTRS
ncbi:MAG: hypothetical protein ACK56I_11115, partial [bacterium]